MSLDPAVFRVTDYGGEVTQSTLGGSAVEYYCVQGLGPEEFSAAHALGLPNRGDTHVVPELSFVGPVISVTRVREFPPSSWLARVVYSSSGSFNFSNRLGASLSILRETVTIPILSSVGSGAGWIMRAPYMTIPRYGFNKTISVKTGLSQDDIGTAFAQNVNKIYILDGINYQLADIRIMTDAGNNSRVDTYFTHRAPIRDFPIGFFAQQDAVIPELTDNSDYDVDVLDGVVYVRDPVLIRGNGDVLPWLP